MLCITMRRGEYITLGDDIVIQVERLNSERVHLNVSAPRQVAVLRGEVLERGGGRRPGCVYDT